MWNTTLDTRGASNEAPLSVSSALQLAKGALEQIRVTIVGEVSEFNDKPGYKAAYFTIADKQSSLSCIMWRDKYLASGIELKAGMLLELSGYFTAYPAKGRMQFSVNRLELAGEGNLRQQVARLAKKLQAEGLMDQGRKKEVPAFCTRIGLITSPRGKAVHDVLRTLRRRNPLVEIEFFGVAVEGERAPQEMAYALDLADKRGLDAILLVRGGGAYEDLMPFNDEMLARKIASLSTPLVSGIGHEPDNSIADMVADRRASTPTAAAESVAPDLSELKAGKRQQSLRLAKAMELLVERKSQSLSRQMSRPVLAEASWLEKYDSNLALQHDRFLRAIPQGLKRDEEYLERISQSFLKLAQNFSERYHKSLQIKVAKLESLSPLKVLTRGYAFTTNEAGNLVDSVTKVEAGDLIHIRLQDGSLHAQVQSKDTIQGA